MLVEKTMGKGVVLNIKAGRFGYGSRIVILIRDLSIRRGERLSLVGPSGCGKTTLLSAIAGASEPLDGTVELDGAVRDANWRVQSVARTLQAFPLLHWLTVRQNLALACRIRRVSPSVIDEILHQLSASHLAHLYPRQLSGGERCRASLAQSVIGHPKLLLLDEPFTGLDLLVKEDVAHSLFDFAARMEIAVVLVTHDIEDAATFSERVVVLGLHPVTEIIADIPAKSADALVSIRNALKGNA